jgi:hypothetical protein
MVPDPKSPMIANVVAGAAAVGAGVAAVEAVLVAAPVSADVVRPADDPVAVRRTQAADESETVSRLARRNRDDRRDFVVHFPCVGCIPTVSAFALTRPPSIPSPFETDGSARHAAQVSLVLV